VASLDPLLILEFPKGGFSWNEAVFLFILSLIIISLFTSIRGVSACSFSPNNIAIGIFGGGDKCWICSICSPFLTELDY
jgi:hypothetical protein